MSEYHAGRWQEPVHNGSPQSDEGGLRAPPGLNTWRKAWWWFDFIILVKLARLRFIGVLVVIGLVIVKWDTLNAYYEKWTRSHEEEQVARSDTEYFCPMHPSVVRDNAKEKCPICFMPLSRRKKGEGREETLPPGVVNRVQLSPYRVVLGGVQTWKVDYLPLVKEITTVGYVEFNERNLKQVAARVKGRIEKLFVNETGQTVLAGDELAELYSPDLVTTMHTLLDAQRSNNVDLQRITRNRLLLWGIDGDQIDALVRTGKPVTNLKIRSPIHGHVIQKYVREGQYVEEGMPLYDVADLSNVWIQGQVYEDEIAFLGADGGLHQESRHKGGGLPVTATTRAFPNQPFQGRLTFVYPHVDQDMRTLTVRFEVDNPGHKLLPGTSASVKLSVPLKRMDLFTETWAENWARENAVCTLVQALSGPTTPTAISSLEPLLRAAGSRGLLEMGLVLAVPESAVIDTGSRQIVYREDSPGVYEGVKVELGPRMVGPEDIDYFPVLRGLTAGDLVVTAGSFLIDAETRLNPAAGSIYFGGSGSKGGPSATMPVRPSMPEDEEAQVRAAFAKLPTEAERRLAKAQKFCPILKDSKLGSMGTPVKLMLDGQPVYLCCDGCKKAALANPKETLAKVEKLKQTKTGPSRD